VPPHYLRYPTELGGNSGGKIDAGERRPFRFPAAASDMPIETGLPG
jgi:hypothetical protein